MTEDRRSGLVARHLSARLARSILRARRQTRQRRIWDLLGRRTAHSARAGPL